VFLLIHSFGERCVRGRDDRASTTAQFRSRYSDSHLFDLKYPAGLQLKFSSRSPHY
jgi:hypothetical protein